jgi:NAD+ synthase (glutamine-hydrolysing)
MHSERIAGGQESAGRVKLEEVSELPFIKPCIDESLERLNGLSAIDKTYNLMSKGISVGLWDWGIKTSIGHYALSLSGGADSALCAVLVYMSHIYAFTELGENEYNKTLKSVGFKEEAHSIEDIVNIIMPKAFVTVYQKTDNNSDKTEGAARALAESIGAEFHSLNIQSIVDSFEAVFNDAVATPLSWDNKSDDIPLQNLQARTRNPMVWLFANRGNRILMTTSNKSENSVGYCSQDGDTAGVISPIGGVNKSNIVGNDEKPEEQGLLKFLFNRGALLESGEMHKLIGLEQVVSLKPSAELRKLEVSQNDEDDLMPFPILDEIERWHQVSRLAPVEILRRVHQTRQDQYTLEEMGEMVDKYIKLFVRSEWSETRTLLLFISKVQVLTLKLTQDSLY